VAWGEKRKKTGTESEKMRDLEKEGPVFKSEGLGKASKKGYNSVSKTSSVETFETRTKKHPLVLGKSDL